MQPSNDAATFAPSTRPGFTLIELMVVISIIALLAALVIAGIGKLRTAAKVHETEKTMRTLGNAVEVYLSTWPRLGDGTDSDSSDFSSRPGYYFTERMIDAGEPQLADYRQPILRENVFYDSFGAALTWTITNGPAPQHPLTQSVEIRATRGTDDDTSDDLVYTIDIANSGKWTWDQR